MQLQQQASAQQAEQLQLQLQQQKNAQQDEQMQQLQEMIARLMSAQPSVDAGGNPKPMQDVSAPAGPPPVTLAEEVPNACPTKVNKSATAPPATATPKEQI